VDRIIDELGFPVVCCEKKKSEVVNVKYDATPEELDLINAAAKLIDEKEHPKQSDKIH
jgi:hypothetical protein